MPSQSLLACMYSRFDILFSYNCYNQLSGTAEVAKLTEVDPLPGAEIQSAIGDGNGDADTTQCRFGVGRHIVSTLQCMFVLRTVLRNQAVEDSFHVHTDIRVAVLVDAQSATSMLREDVHDARLRQLWQLAHYLARHQVKAS